MRWRPARIKNKVFAAFGSFTWAKGAVGAKMDEYAARMGLDSVGYAVMKQTLDDDSRAAARRLGSDVAARLTCK